MFKEFICYIIEFCGHCNEIKFLIAVSPLFTVHTLFPIYASTLDSRVTELAHIWDPSGFGDLGRIAIYFQVAGEHL